MFNEILWLTLECKLQFDVSFYCEALRSFEAECRQVRASNICYVDVFRLQTIHLGNVCVSFF